MTAVDTVTCVILRPDQIDLIAEALAAKLKRPRRIKWSDAPRTCERCAKEFRPLREHQRFCSPRCRWAAQKTRVRA